MFDEYESYDAMGLAGLVAEGSVSASEVLEAAIERVEARNPAVNAVVHRLDDEARAAVAAGLPDGPFTGVPFLIKDLNAHVAGAPTTNGSRLFADAVATVDSEFVARWRRSGMAILGKTNSPEFGLTGTTEPLLFGPSRNPWDLGRTTGGSSGGAAAAVASGMVPAAHATDGGGSIRIPASACGLVGLKPTRGRVTQAPHAGEGWAGMSIGGTVTRSVRDTAALLDAVCAPHPGDPYWAPPPARPFLDEVGADPGQLRIALVTVALSGAAVDPECVAAAEHAARACEALGHHVEHLDRWPALGPALAGAYLIMTANLVATVDERLSTLGRSLRDDDLEPGTLGAYETGKAVTGAQYALAVRGLHAASRTMAEFHAIYDLVCSPTLGTPPVPIGWLDPNGDTALYRQRIGRFVGFTQLFNVTGQPAISLPLWWTTGSSGDAPAGLPVGVQLGARFGDEATLIRVATQLEQAHPWFDRTAPPVA